MKTLYLADLFGMTEDDVKSHLACDYAGEVSGFDYGCVSSEDVEKATELLSSYNVLIAYEHVGDCGCDSASWFLLQHKETKEYFTIHGSHCSCFGFEGQLDLEPTPIEYLKSNKFYMGTGGYDDKASDNTDKIKAYLNSL